MNLYAIKRDLKLATVNCTEENFELHHRIIWLLLHYCCSQEFVFLCFRYFKLHWFRKE